MDGLSSIRYISGLNSNFKTDKYFGHVLKQRLDNDAFLKTEDYLNEKTIKKLIISNPKIINILRRYNLPLKLNMAEYKDLMEHHAKDTATVSSAIAKNLPKSLRQNVDIYILNEGAMLHDIGKILIPEKILNKPASLSASEYEIMNLHGELGYQILKNSGISPKTLELIKYHHNPYDSKPDINIQILNLADKYSALTETRVYKEAYSPQKALAILYSEVKKNKINPILFKALVKAVSNEQAVKLTAC